jgi:hypothetical protein
MAIGAQSKFRILVAQNHLLAKLFTATDVAKISDYPFKEYLSIIAWR